MKKQFFCTLLSFFVLFGFMMNASSETMERKIIKWAIKQEVKTETQKVADKYLDPTTKKALEKEWKEFKKYKKEQEKKFKKKQKRIKKKQEEDIKKEKEKTIKDALKFDDEEEYEFRTYNEPQGTQELDFFGIYGKRQMSCEGVISPDYQKMVYSEVHFYPGLYQLTSELFTLHLCNEENAVERVMHTKLANKQKMHFYRAGMNKVEEQFFRTLTPVDWSFDSKKILIKERLAENLRCFLETRVWVHEETTHKTYYVQNLRLKIANLWIKKGIDLDYYKWDLSPQGWYETEQNKKNGISPNRIIVDAYGYKPDRTKVYLGSYLVNYKTCDVVEIKNPKLYPSSQNGLVLRKKRKI